MWFGVSLLYRSTHLIPTADGIWEEVVVLVQASSQDNAEKIASEFAKSREVEYDVAAGDRVFWIFDSISGICEVEQEEIQSGIEIFSRFLRDSEVASMRTKLE
jgi:hypothetical protein